MVVASARRELNHFQRPAQIHVEAAFLGLAIQRCSAMNDRIGGVDQARVIVVSKAEARIRQIADKYSDARIQVFFKAREFQMQLQGSPKTLARFLSTARADQQVQRLGMVRKQVRRDMCADIAGGSGQKDGHVVCQDAAVEAELAASAAFASACPASCTERRGRDSSWRPSMRG